MMKIADGCLAPVPGAHVVDCNDYTYEQRSSPPSSLSKIKASDCDESCNLVPADSGDWPFGWLHSRLFVGAEKGELRKLHGGPDLR